MGRAMLVLLLTTLLPLASANSRLFAREYLDTVCKPATKNPTDTVPPCVSVETIETLCEPNGTAPIYLAAHQQCMCGGSFFAEWPACQNCLFYHGLRNEREVAQYDGILSAVSSSFCGTATPTAVFASIFKTIQSSFPVPSTGGTVSSDMAPSSTAVSLYYTASVSQGPGAITGSAAGATATGPRTTPAPAATGSAVKTGSTSGAGSGTQSTSSGGSAAGPGTKATTGPSGSAGPSASSKPTGSAAPAMSRAHAGVLALGVIAAVVAAAL
jgi:hypothetical protein